MALNFDKWRTKDGGIPLAKVTLGEVFITKRDLAIILLEWVNIYHENDNPLEVIATLGRNKVLGIVRDAIIARGIVWYQDCSVHDGLNQYDFEDMGFDVDDLLDELEASL